jgi:hypothetical protein
LSGNVSVCDFLFTFVVSSTGYTKDSQSAVEIEACLELLSHDPVAANPCSEAASANSSSDETLSFLSLIDIKTR